MVAPTEVAFSTLLFAGIGVMLLAAGMLLAFLMIYQRRLLRQQLHLRAAEAAHQQQLLTAIIEAQESERERIGRDLHDGVGSTISTAKMLISRLGQPLPGDDPAALRQLLTSMMTTAVQDVRGISHSLYPAVLTRFGLADALHELVDTCNEAGPVPVSLEIEYPQSLPLAQELALYRICQELLHNARKHALGASFLAVELQQRATGLTLTVEDDGCGFGFADDAPPRPGQGIGLRSVELRVQMLRAQLHRQSAPGQGTTIRVEMAPSGPTEE